MAPAGDRPVLATGGQGSARSPDRPWPGQLVCAGRRQNGLEDAMSGTEQAEERGVIRDQPVVDFSHLKSADDLAAISRIQDVAIVLLPESLAAAYARIP